jgi:hypothetical protein
MSAIGSERGVALLAVLGVILALLPLAVAVGMQTQLDGLMGRNLRGGTAALYAAEAGLAHALSEIGPRVDFDAILHGPDGIVATTDDGRFPFRSAPLPPFARAPLGYDVSVARGPSDTIRVHSRGRAHHESVREVEALVAPSSAPFTPAAVYLEAADVAVDLGTHGFQLSGLAGARHAPVVALAPSSSASAVRLSETLAAAQVTGAGGAPSIAAAVELGLGAYADDLGSRLDAVILPGEAAGAELGTEARPQLTVVDGSWVIDAHVDGFGILVVRGDLEVGGSLRYRGLVLARGAFSSTATGDVHIDGALWMHAAAGARLELRGSGSIRYDPAALERVDAAIDGALMHLPLVVGWRETW